eukprot:COSAG04_NODE_612_length_11991_cov_17.359569_2_plen_46_part_00
MARLWAYKDGDREPPLPVVLVILRAALPWLRPRRYRALRRDDEGR